MPAPHQEWCEWILKLSLPYVHQKWVPSLPSLSCSELLVCLCTLYQLPMPWLTMQCTSCACVCRSIHRAIQQLTVLDMNASAAVDARRELDLRIGGYEFGWSNSYPRKGNAEALWPVFIVRTGVLYSIVCKHRTHITHNWTCTSTWIDGLTRQDYFTCDL